MRLAGSLPAVGPFPIGEVEAGLAVGVVEGSVYGKGAGCRVELQQEEARFGAGDNHALCFCVPAGPVRHISIVEFYARDFDGLGRIRDIEHDHAVDHGDALNQEVSDDRGHAAERSGKAVDQLRLGFIGVDGADALDAASESLDVDRSIGTEARLFRTDLGIVIVALIEICGLKAV